MLNAVNFHTDLARPEGFEPPTPKFVAWCSIQLSYGRRSGIMKAGDLFVNQNVDINLSRFKTTAPFLGQCKRGACFRKVMPYRIKSEIALHDDNHKETGSAPKIVHPIS